MRADNPNRNVPKNLLGVGGLVLLVALAFGLNRSNREILTEIANKALISDPNPTLLENGQKLQALFDLLKEKTATDFLVILNDIANNPVEVLKDNYHGGKFLEQFTGGLITFYDSKGHNVSFNISKVPDTNVVDITTNANFSPSEFVADTYTSHSIRSFILHMMRDGGFNKVTVNLGIREALGDCKVNLYFSIDHDQNKQANASVSSYGNKTIYMTFDPEKGIGFLPEGITPEDWTQTIDACES